MDAYSISKLYAPFITCIDLDEYIEECRSGAIDCNNLIGFELIQIQMLTYLYQHADDSAKEGLISKLKVESNKAIKNFFSKIEAIVKSKNLRRCYAVFDGRKLDKKKPKNQRQFYWKHLPRNMVANDSPHLKRQTIKYTKTKNFWEIYTQIISTIQMLLEKNKIIVFVAPYDSDSQIVKLYNQGLIQWVFSNDYQFAHFGVPQILNISKDGSAALIDLERTDPQFIEDDLLKRWLIETQIHKNKKIIFCTLSGSSFLIRFLYLNLRQIMEIVLRCTCIRHFFQIIAEERPELEVPKYYAAEAEDVMKIFLFGTCFSLRQNKLQYLNEEKGIYKLEKGNAKQVINNFKIIGPFYEYSQNHRRGMVNVHTNQPRRRLTEIRGGSTQEIYQQIYNREQWLDLMKGTSK